MDSDTLFSNVLDRLSYCMNGRDAEVELQKLLSMEMTTNVQGKDLDHLELLNIVILRLARFYQDQELEELWLRYIEALEKDHSRAA